MSHSTKRPSSAQDEDTTAPHPEVVDIPNTLEARVTYINKEKQHVISKLCVWSGRAKGLPDPADPATKQLLHRLDSFLRWLSNIDITPILKAKSGSDKILQLIYADPRYHFDEPTRERARQLYIKWESQNWGKGEVLDDSSDGDEQTEATVEDVPADGKRRKSSTSTATKRDFKADIVATTYRLPPSSHPIFGENGIMHGLMLKLTASRKAYIIDSRYTKRDAKVFGHNGLEVGSWWPMQLAALFHGAHGAKKAGIAGNQETGAYSVVTSGGQYEELDQDKGDVLHYSGSQSHDNENPREPFPSTGGTNALKASMRNRKPVRVLRAAGVGGNRTGNNIRPTVGIRYDGLDRVIALQLKTNTKGGLYEQFKLERLDGQTPLDNIAKARPTASEIRDYHRRDQAY